MGQLHFLSFVYRVLCAFLCTFKVCLLCCVIFMSFFFKSLLTLGVFRHVHLLLPRVAVSIVFTVFCSTEGPEVRF